MFLSVEWAKRWLAAVFLLMSLFLPWWTVIWTQFYVRPYGERVDNLILSFPWGAGVDIYKVKEELGGSYYAQFY